MQRETSDDLWSNKEKLISGYSPVKTQVKRVKTIPYIKLSSPLLPHFQHHWMPGLKAYLGPLQKNVSYFRKNLHHRCLVGS